MSNRIFLRFPNFKDKALTLSYDDGVRQDKRLISIMDKFGIKGTFNLNGGMFDTARSDIPKGRLSLEEAIELYKDSVHEIAIHGFRHLTWGIVDSAVATNDIVKDRSALEEAFDRIVMGMAYPNGTSNCTETSMQILKNCNIKYGRTTESSLGFEIPTNWLKMPATCHHNNPQLMEIFDKFLEKPKYSSWWAKRARLFYLWGHSYEFDDYNNWHVIEEFCKRVGGRNDIWYATNGEIYDYVTAFDRLEWSIDEKFVYNPSAIDVYVNCRDKEFIVPAGKTVKI